MKGTGSELLLKAIEQEEKKIEEELASPISKKASAPVQPAIDDEAAKLAAAEPNAISVRAATSFI